MSKNNIVILLAIAVVVLAGAFFFVSDKSAPFPDGESVDQDADVGGQSPQVVPGSQETFTVSYTDSGFSPRSITVKSGDTVVFKNNGAGAFWLGSDPHPLHNNYPTTGGCISSTFDSCARVTSGQSFSFVFDVAGSWGYHNHLNPSQRGTVVVQ